MKRILALAVLASLSASSTALAWGAYGHRLIGVCAARALPEEVPAFLRNEQAVWALGELAREPDRSKGAGQPHDYDLDPGHFINADDAGLVGGAASLTALPRNRAEYENVLRSHGAEGARNGWLPYNIADGWQQLVKDFGYYRVDIYGAEHAADPAQRRWFRRDATLREMLILRDLGYWSHFVGDGSQPLHVTVHHTVWGDYPNPNHYMLERIHSPFEGDFVHGHTTDADVSAAMTPLRVISSPILEETASYLETSRQQVEPLYALWTAGAFTGADTSKAKAYTVGRLAYGASELRDLVVAAWRASPEATVGYPAVKVSAIEAGAVPIPFDAIVGAD
jgi:hypothetical protein